MVIYLLSSLVMSAANRATEQPKSTWTSSIIILIFTNSRLYTSNFFGWSSSFYSILSKRRYGSEVDILVSVVFWYLQYAGYEVIYALIRFLT